MISLDYETKGKKEGKYMLEYNIKEFRGDLFYKETIKDLERNFKENMEIADMFANEIEVDKSPTTLYCPIEKEKIDFAFPFALKVKKLFNFIKGRYDSFDEIKQIISEVKSLSKSNWFSKNFVQEGTNQGLLNSRIGFMITLAEKRIKLYNGRDLSANELAMLIGVTNQGVVNKISRGKLDAKKVGVRYHIENEDVWELLVNRDDDNIQDNGIQYYSYGKFKMQDSA